MSPQHEQKLLELLAAEVAAQPFTAGQRFEQHVADAWWKAQQAGIYCTLDQARSLAMRELWADWLRGHPGRAGQSLSVAWICHSLAMLEEQYAARSLPEAVASGTLIRGCADYRYWLGLLDRLAELAQER